MWAAAILLGVFQSPSQSYPGSFKILPLPPPPPPEGLSRASANVKVMLCALCRRFIVVAAVYAETKLT